MLSMYMHTALWDLKKKSQKTILLEQAGLANLHMQWNGTTWTLEVKPHTQMAQVCGQR